MTDQGYGPPYKALVPAILQLHLEPAEPIEVAELTAALGSLSRQYQAFAARAGYGEKASDARLMVASVSPGSIDINLMPYVALATGLLAPLIPYEEVIGKFLEGLSSLFSFFGKHKSGSLPSHDITIKDCDDAINIASPIANRGGSQTFLNFHGDVWINPIISMDASEAREIVEGAVREKGRLLSPLAAKSYQRVSMVWKRIDSDEVATKGIRSPDKGLIEEIDSKPHAVLFTDEMTYLKAEMMEPSQNPHRKVYFVDVEVSRVGDKVAAYRIVGYHGHDDLD